MIHVKTKKKTYVAPSIEELLIEDDNLMTIVSATGKDQPTDGPEEWGVKQGNFRQKDFYYEDEFFDEEELDEPDAIDLVLQRFRFR